MVDKNKPKAFVVSDVCGQRGGAYRVTSMLSTILNDLGIETTCFSTHVENDYVAPQGVTIARPIFRHGYRWDFPNRVLAWQIAKSIKKHHPKLIISVGLTSLCGHLLDYTNIKNQNLWIWELTDAQPGNKFVNSLAKKRLARSCGLLSPAPTIDRAIRSTYSYQGVIRRLPFWIEAGATQYTASPPAFQSDFLFLSRRENDKGLGDLINAAKILHSQNLSCKIMIAGIGDKTLFEEMVHAGNLESMINFVELPTREEAMNALSKTKFMVLPSHHEGFPISILESIQRSIPVITTMVGAIPDVLGESDAVIYHEKQNIPSLADALVKALTEPGTAYECRREAAFARYDSLYSREQIEYSLADIIN
jgi:glycosyltransferase involved in cell wall biosynthesis